MYNDTQAIRDVQTRWIEATIAGDLEALRPLMADDIVFLTPGRPPFGLDKLQAACP
jgi:uncharacterized protein (TIGR02246 family)